MPKALLCSIVCTIALAACGTSAVTDPQDASAAGAVKLVDVGTFSKPLYLTSPPTDKRRVMVVEQAGRIMVVRDGRKRSVPFLDIRSRVRSGGEQGLLGLAFAPDYARSGLFYVYFTRTDGRQEIAEFRRLTSERARSSSYRSVLIMDDAESNHNGGDIAFGSDKMLYVGTGDGGGGGDNHGTIGNAQDLGSLLGKMLRIDPRRSASRAYSVPRSNPFLGTPGARPEIYAYGLRNPWRWSFDRSNGNLVIGDVGQSDVEEIDYLSRAAARGANFGWRVREGNQQYGSGSLSGAVEPVITHTHDSGWCSITGGYVVRDPALTALRGLYVYGDFCMGKIYSAKLDASGATGDQAVAGLPRINVLSSFGEDARGRIYVVSLGGAVRRLAAG
ncbi:MAG: glucose dehydrogenase [Actinobacteria bacterium]|uniref:Unannotated protein n=1 Tax=freshwater metagenome TaxID=449393 RepID=A0A6J5ZKM7_9ZZZZ|nr:glucose dehydrogenase [Actinomycetota bacterium]